MNPILFGIVFGVIVGAIVIATVSIIIRLRKKEKINKIKEKPMSKEEIINKLFEDFTRKFWNLLKEENLEVTEVTNDDIKNMLVEFFNKETLTQAESYFSDALEDYIDGSYDKVNNELTYEEKQKTPEWQAWKRLNDIEYIWYKCRKELEMDEKWVEVNGKAHTDEEAATIAADKWCELLFGWHLQDNGALNENHPGGFPACALATVLANGAKDEITEEMKQKSHELLKQYYMKYIHFSTTFDLNDVHWLKETFKSSDEKKFNWEHGFNYDMYCDYNPSWALYTILYNAGIPEKNIDCICPWKTGISIRTVDNSVRYQTYQHVTDL